MSKIGDAVIHAEEEDVDICWFSAESWHDENCPYCKKDAMKKWQEDTRKMHELAERWDGVYPEIEGVVGKVRYIKGKENEHI